jgi:hypothetical protein
MNEPQYQPAVDDRHDDEIDLRELVRALWETRYVVGLALLGFAGLFWLAVIALGARDGLTYTWETRIYFTFSGASEGQYPNETPFSSADLLSPVVIRRVYEQNDLQSTGLSRSDFSDALSVAGYAPTREFIVQRYRSRLEQDRLTAAEISEIEEEFADALEQARQGQARLTLTLRDGLLPDGGVLSDELARKVLLDIPRVWSRYMTEEAGVFASDISLYSADAVEDGLFGAMGELVSTDVLKNKFGLLSSNVEALQELDNAGAVRDPETGLGLSDISAQADWLESFVLEDIRATALQLGVSGNPEVTPRFFRSRIDEMVRRKALLETRAERVQQALQDYLAGQARSSQVAGMGESIAPMRQNDLRGATTIPQFDSGFLDRLVELGADSGDIQFRQDLTRERLDYTLEAAELQAEIDRMTELVELIPGDGGDQQQSEDIRELAASIRPRLNAVTRELRELFLASERISTLLNELRFGGQEAIYNIVQPPGEATTPPLVLTRSNLQRFVLGAFLVVILSVMGVFLFNMLRERTGD